LLRFAEAEKYEEMKEAMMKNSKYWGHLANDKSI